MHNGYLINFRYKKAAQYTYIPQQPILLILVFRKMLSQLFPEVHTFLDTSLLQIHAL